MSTRDLRTHRVSSHYPDWQAEPWSRGACSYAPIDSLPAADAMSQPVDQTLYFAGEHTAPDGHWRPVHGALASGEQAANQLLSTHGLAPRSGEAGLHKLAVLVHFGPSPCAQLSGRLQARPFMDEAAAVRVALTIPEITATVDGTVGVLPAPYCASSSAAGSCLGCSTGVCSPLVPARRGTRSSMYMISCLPICTTSPSLRLYLRTRFD